MANGYQGIAGRRLARMCAITLTIMGASLAAQPTPYDSAKPLLHATLFAPGIISTGDYESHATLTPDGRELYFLKMALNFSRWTIFVSRYKDGSWSQPEVAPFSGQRKNWRAIDDVVAFSSDGCEPVGADSAGVWAEYVRVWTAWNHVRTFAAVAASVLLMLALWLSAFRRSA